MTRSHPAERTLVFVDQLRRWMKVADARTALGVDAAQMRRMCDDGTLRVAATPLGRLVDPHSVGSLKAKAEAEEEGA